MPGAARDTLSGPDGPRLEDKAMHIAGSTRHLTAQQRELIDLAATLGRERFAPRAALHDAQASFPAQNYQDLRDAGLLALCVPREHGGLGADFATYMLVAAEIGRHCGATALTFNMHVCACLWAGPVADAIDMAPEQRADHGRHRFRSGTDVRSGQPGAHRHGHDLQCGPHPVD